MRNKKMIVDFQEQRLTEERSKQELEEIIRMNQQKVQERQQRAAQEQAAQAESLAREREALQRSRDMLRQRKLQQSLRKAGATDLMVVI